MKKFLLILGCVLLLGQALVHADAHDDFKSSLEARQLAVSDAFDKLNTRVDLMDSRDPKKDGAKDLLGTAEDAVKAFKDLPAGDHIQVIDEANDVFDASQAFKDAEREAQTAMNAVNLYIFTPARPGAGAEGSVPQGDLVKNFIPQVIRQLFRFVSLAILVGIIVAAIMLITSFDNEERHSQAKKILIFALVGFVFVALAFALVTAITHIDFFATPS